MPSSPLSRTAYRGLGLLETNQTPALASIPSLPEEAEGTPPPTGVDEVLSAPRQLL